jgi:guanylate kinase
MNKDIKQILNKSNRKKVLVLVGVSGSGKSVLEKNCIKKYPGLFNKLYQVSTRDKREPLEDSYLFLTKKFYKKFQDFLWGKTEINGDLYGTIPDLRKNKINTIILNEKGLKDFLDKADPDVEFFVLGLDIDFDDLPVKRKNRGEEHLEEEREVLKYAEYTYKIQDANYLNPTDVLDILLEENFIKKD